jgi:MFS family permease
MNFKGIKIIILLTAGMFINAIDRGSLGIAAPMIIKELHIDSGIMGIALSAFYWSYIVLMFPIGRFADKYGAKKTLGWSAVLWSCMSAVTGFVHSAHFLILARLGVGAGEAAGNVVSAKIVSENFPSNERATATGFYLSGTKLGMAAVPVIMGVLMSNWNWRVAFLVTGLISLLWCVAWYYGFKEVSRSVEVTSVSTKVVIPWRKLLANRCVLGLMIAKFFLDYLFILFVTWVPAYLIMERGFSILKMGVYASLPWIAGFISQPAMGYFSDWLIKKGIDVTPARKYTLVAFQLIAASVLAVGYIDDPVIACILLTINVAAESASAGIMWTILSEVSPRKLGGTVPAAINTVSSIAGLFAPTITGFIYQFTGSFQIALFVGGCGVLISALAILFIVPDIKPIQLQED